MFQKRPLNANEKLLRRFYGPGLDENSKLWRNYVDQLSFVCDSEKGGDTVTAVAAQQTNEGPIYWIASNSKSREKARSHLIWIFARLAQLYAANPISTALLQVEITAQCIEFSSDRIKTYLAWLLQAIRKVKPTTEEFMSREDKILLQGLEHFESLSTDFHQLCAFAHGFRISESMKILCERHNAQSSRGVWSDIRHFIGRLGSWTKATQILILGAQRFPRRIENAQVKVISPNGPADLPSKEHMTDLQGVIQSMLSSDQVALIEELGQVLTEANFVAQIEGRFHEDYANIKPRPHAELLVLEHFHNKGFSFVADDKYIGCSKPSCYCCHAYMQCHPGGFTPRPCHGNLWINWAPPIPLPVITRRNGKNPSTRPQQHHTFQMLQKMLVSIRQDLQDQILSRRPKRKRLPDSTTGISSVYAMHAPKIALEYNAEEAELWSTDHSVRRLTPFENRGGTDITSLIVQDDASESCPDNADREVDDQLSTEQHTTPVQERNGKFEDNAQEDHDEKAQLVNAENWSEQCSRSRRTESSNDDQDQEDDSDGDVLLFKGRHNQAI